MTTDAKAPIIEIPRIPKRGEIWFSVNLGLVEDVPALYAILATLNLAPKLAYKRIFDEIEIHLLLHHEQRLELHQPPHELFAEEQQTLADLINPDAISFLCGLTATVAA